MRFKPFRTFPHVVRRVTHILTHTKKYKFATKNTRNPKISGVFWSCWADSNRRPHPYQRKIFVFSNLFCCLWPFPLQTDCFPALFGRGISGCSAPVCGWLCGQIHERIRNSHRSHLKIRIQKQNTTGCIRYIYSCAFR